MRALSLICLCTLAGCDGTTAADAGLSGTDAGPSTVDAGPPDAGPPPVDPGLFDCTAGGPPDRASPRPLHCGLDPACTDRLVSAHRGAGAPGVLAPEDTLAAIRAAIAVGADMTEMDVRPTADGTLVLMHDDTVDRTTTGTGRVDALDLAAIQALTVRADGFEGDFGCERVPTFAEALALAAGRITIIVEPKTDRIDLLVADVQAAGALDRVIVDAPPEVIEAALAMEPELRYFVRAESADAVAPALARFAGFGGNPPRYVHVGASTDAALLAEVASAGQRAFVLGFGADIAAELRGSDQPYLDLWAAGIQIVQSNRPHLAAAALE